MVDGNGISSALMARIDRAEQLWLDGDYSAAATELDEVFTVGAVDASGDDGARAAAHYVRGLVRTDLSDLDGAIEDLLLAQRLDCARRDWPHYIDSSQALGAAYDRAGRYANAEMVFRDVLECTRDTYGDDSMEHARALSDLGINLDFQSRSDEATPLLEAAVVLLSGLESQGDTTLDAALSSLGSCALRAQLHEDAERYYQRALTTRIAALGRSHPRVAVIHHNLAVVLARLDRRSEALEHAHAAVVIRSTTLPPDHPWRRESEALELSLR